MKRKQRRCCWVPVAPASPVDLAGAESSSFHLRLAKVKRWWSSRLWTDFSHVLRCPSSRLQLLRASKPACVGCSAGSPCMLVFKVLLSVFESLNVSALPLEVARSKPRLRGD